MFLAEGLNKMIDDPAGGLGFIDKIVRPLFRIRENFVFVQNLDGGLHGVDGSYLLAAAMRTRHAMLAAGSECAGFGRYQSNIGGRR